MIATVWKLRVLRAALASQDIQVIMHLHHCLCMLVIPWVQARRAGSLVGSAPGRRRECNAAALARGVGIQRRLAAAHAQVAYRLPQPRRLLLRGSWSSGFMVLLALAALVEGRLCHLHAQIAHRLPQPCGSRHRVV